MRDREARNATVLALKAPGAASETVPPTNVELEILQSPTSHPPARLRWTWILWASLFSLGMIAGILTYLLIG